MTGWAEGYIADLEYSGLFYPAQAPGHLRLATVIAGFEPPQLEDGFNYCELGCGQGVTANLLAAANPQGWFYAVDFNPAHIVRAREMAAAAGLGNVTFDEKSFLELAEAPPADLPQFDIVTLHGIYSWVSAENQRAIVQFLRRQVKPGGIVYVSYNCMPGWAGGMPVQRLLHDLAAQIPGRSDVRLEKALAIAEDLAKAGIRHLAGNEFLSRVRELFDQQATRYLVHEYLNDNWQPLYFSDLARQLGEAKLSFVASADLIENYPDLIMPPAQREAVAGSAVAGALRETLKDFALPRPFRKDVFIRGARPITPHRRDELLRAMRFAIALPRADIQMTFSTPMGEAEMQKATYEPVFDALARAPRSIAELEALPELRGRSTIQPVELAGMLAAWSQAMPIRPAGSASVDTGDTSMGDSGMGDSGAAARRHNRALAAGIRHGDSNRRYFLASPVTGSGILINLVQALVYSGLAEGEEEPAMLAERIWIRLSARGEKLTRNGKFIESDEENRAVIREHVDLTLRQSLPLWRGLAAI